MEYQLEKLLHKKPRNLLANELVEQIISKYPALIEHLYIAEKTFKVYKIALKADKLLYRFIHKEFEHNSELYKICTNETNAHITLTAKMELIMKYEILANKKLLRGDNYFVRNINSKNKYYIARNTALAAKYNAEVFKLIPVVILMYCILCGNVYINSIRNNGLALKYVPHKYRKEKLCIIAVQNNGLALQYVPDEFKTPVLCNYALINNSLAIQFMSKTIPRKLLHKTLLEINGLTLQYLVSKSGNLLINDIKQNNTVEELCKIAVQNNGLALQFVPKMYLCAELCNIAVKKNELAIQFVPYEYLSIDLCKYALQNPLVMFLFTQHKNLHRYYKCDLNKNTAAIESFLRANPTFCIDFSIDIYAHCL